MMFNRVVYVVALLLLSSIAAAFDVKLISESGGLINVVAKNISPVYGADILIGYDPQFFDVVDQDDKKQGTQITKGNFFAEGAYLLDNRIDLRKGEIHYAVALVRPMDDASGDGVIASFKLKAKKSGNTVVEIKKAEFGTQEGELHKAKPMKLAIIADASGQFTATNTSSSDDAGQGLPVSMEALLMIVIVALLLVVIILLLRKK